MVIFNVNPELFSDHVDMSRLVCQFVGMFYIFLLYSGTSLHGGIVFETDRLKDGVLLPNFFLSYLLAVKEVSSLVLCKTTFWRKFMESEL